MKENVATESDAIFRKIWWMRSHFNLCLWFALAYVVCVFCTKRYMVGRSAFHLRTPFFLWNASFCVLNGVVMCRCSVVLISEIEEFGLDYSMCQANLLEFWGFVAWLYLVATLLQTADTIWQVLRKDDFLFNHWFYSVIMVVFSWFAFTDFSALSKWTMTLNAAMQAIFYGYRLCCLLTKVPQWVALTFAFCDLFQIVFACGLFTRAYLKHEGCDVTKSVVHIFLLVDFSLLLLRLHLLQKNWREKCRLNAATFSNQPAKNAMASTSKKASAS